MANHNLTFIRKYNSLPIVFFFFYWLLLSPIFFSGLFACKWYSKVLFATGLTLFSLNFKVISDKVSLLLALKSLSNCWASTVPSLGTFQWRGQEIFSGQHFSKTSSFTMTFNYVTSKSSNPKGHLLFKIVNFHAKWSRDVERTTFFQKPAVWPKPCDLQINRDHLLHRASTVTSLANFKQRNQKILSGHPLVYRPILTIRTTNRCKTICLLFSKGGIITFQL